MIPQSSPGGAVLLSALVMKPKYHAHHVSALGLDERYTCFGKATVFKFWYDRVP
jgi:hypothetical protein